MAITIQDFLNRRAEYFGEDVIDGASIPDWQREEIARALRLEQPSGNVKHISRSLVTGNRKVACGTSLSAIRSKDIIDPWTFEMLHQEGRTDLCLSCKRAQRKAWTDIRKDEYCQAA